MRPHALRMRVLRAGKRMPHAPSARLSDHDMAIAAARPARDRALVIAAMAHAKGHDLATVARDRGSAIVVADASAVVVVGRVDARFVHSVSIM